MTKLIYSPGTQVVSAKPIYGSNDAVAHPAGAVGVIIKSPTDQSHPYRVRFADGFEAQLRHDQLTLLSQFKLGAMSDPQDISTDGLFQHVIYRCVVGSRAFGLDDEHSDTDRRGIYLPPANLHWSLYGVPEQLENEERQEAYWELQKFIVMALKANPNILECLYTPLIEKVTPVAQELLDNREIFLSKLVYQTYSGYVASQFKKIQSDIRNQGRVKWKHVMHLIRLLISGINVLEKGLVTVDVGSDRDRLLSIKAGDVSIEQADKWRLELQKQLSGALEKTKLPGRPNYEKANELLISARKSMVADA